MQQNYFFLWNPFFFLMADFSPKKVLSEICCIIITNVYIPSTDISQLEMVKGLNRVQVREL